MFGHPNGRRAFTAAHSEGSSSARNEGRAVSVSCSASRSGSGNQPEPSSRRSASFAMSTFLRWSMSCAACSSVRCSFRPQGPAERFFRHHAASTRRETALDRSSAIGRLSRRQPSSYRTRLWAKPRAAPFALPHISPGPPLWSGRGVLMLSTTILLSGLGCFLVLC